MINGLFATLESYDELCSYLLDEFNILRYDCRGQGKTEKPIDGYSLNDHVSDLQQIIDENKIDSLFLLGLSNGARVALEFSIKNPKKVKALIACDTYDEITPMISLKLKSWLVAYELGGATHRFDVATPWVWGESLVNSKPELISYYRDRCDSFPSYAVKGLIKGAMESSIDLSLIKIPTLYIVGDEDLLTPYFLHEKMLKKSQINSPLCELSKIRGGHASILESCEQASIVIKKYLKRFL